MVGLAVGKRDIHLVIVLTAGEENATTHYLLQYTSLLG